MARMKSGVNPEVKKFISSSDDAIQNTIKDRLKKAKSSYLRGQVRQDARVFRDNEQSTSGFVSLGYLSTFFTRGSAKYGWDQTQREAFGEPTKHRFSPASKFRVLSLIVGAVVLAGTAIGTVAGLNATGFVDITARIGRMIIAGATVLGGLAGLVTGYFESAKLRQEEFKGRSRARNTLADIVGAVQRSQNSEKINAIAQSREHEELLDKTQSDDIKNLNQRVSDLEQKFASYSERITAEKHNKEKAVESVALAG